MAENRRRIFNMTLDASAVLNVSQPLLSVIVPVYNEAATIDLLMQRLLDGPYPDKEVIVVNDGSRDATPPMLQRWAASPGVRVVHHPNNRGKGAAVRTGLAHARGLITILQDA